MSHLKVLIADDEKPARSKMKRLLGKFDNVEIIHEAENGLDALENIKKLKPDVAFLDIEMPGLNGLDVASELRQEPAAPYIVFATAYNEHAIKAFELNAIDYLLKPFNEERLGATLDKILGGDRKEQVSDQQKGLKKLEEEDDEPLPFSNKIPVPTFDRYLLIDFDEVICIEVEDRNTVLYTAKNTYTMNHTLEYFETKLPAEKFFRANRSSLIGLEHVKEIIIWFGNRLKIVLKNDHEVVASRERSRKLRDVLRF